MTINTCATLYKDKDGNTLISTYESNQFYCLTTMQFKKIDNISEIRVLNPYAVYEMFYSSDYLKYKNYHLELTPSFTNQFKAYHSYVINLCSSLNIDTTLDLKEHIDLISRGSYINLINKNKEAPILITYVTNSTFHFFQYDKEKPEKSCYSSLSFNLSSGYSFTVLNSQPTDSESESLFINTKHNYALAMYLKILYKRCEEKLNSLKGKSNKMIINVGTSDEDNLKPSYLPYNRIIKGNSLFNKINSTCKHVSDLRKRKPEFILSSLMEEVGEISKALIQLKDPDSYKFGEALDEPIENEIVDAIICLVDLLYTLNPDVSELDLVRIASVKCNKWKRKLEKEN